MKIFNSKRKIPIFHFATSKTEIGLKAATDPIYDIIFDIIVLKSTAQEFYLRTRTTTQHERFKKDRIPGFFAISFLNQQKFFNH